MNSTNIVTLRRYNDGSTLLFINGREVPYVKSVERQQIGFGESRYNIVTVTLYAEQFNELQADEPAPSAAVPMTKTGDVALHEVEGLTHAKPIIVPTWVAYAAYALTVALAAIATYAVLG